ncbi:MAG: hypothetical protein ABII06_21855 [Pseudomonadota bacterium]
MQIEHLCFMAGGKSIHRLEGHLCNPLFTDWEGMSPEALFAYFRDLKQRTAGRPGFQDLIELRLLSECLLKRPALPDWVPAFCEDHLEVARFVGPLTWAAARSGTWRAVPVLLASEGTRTVWFVAGLAPSGRDLSLFPVWAESFFDSSALRGAEQGADSARRVASLPNDHAFFTYPLIRKTPDFRISGGSLALPLALGFAAAASEETFDTRVAATGRLDEEGRTAGIGNLESKAWHAEEQGFLTLMFPEDNRLPRKIGSMETLPVKGIEEALMFARLYEPGKSGDLILLSRMCGDPGRFLDNCASMPATWLDRARSSGMLGRVLEEIRKSWKSVEKLCLSHKRCLEKWDMERAEAVSALLEPEDLLRIEADAPAAALRWCTGNIELFNHRGDAVRAAKWVQRGEPLLEAVRRYDPDLCAAYYNLAFTARQIQYRFDPDLPPMLLSILEYMKRRYEVAREMGCETDATLGALYGSIAQHYGFCGPDHLEPCLRYVSLAKQAFGGGRFPELRDDWLRQENYAVYALLDAGLFDKAEAALLMYLDIDARDVVPEVFEGLSPWHHAALARWLADTGNREIGRTYLEVMYEEGPHLMGNQHPAQLWLHNLGRIAHSLDRRDQAVNLFRKSLDLCLLRGQGPALRLMALLPLSGLDLLGILDRAEAESLWDRLRAEAGSLNPGHFRLPVEEPDLKTALCRLREKPGRLFPFSYR